MKVLLDECVSKKAKALLTDCEVFTVRDMGFQGLKNEKLLQAAEEHAFDIVLTIDKNISSQQNTAKYHVALVILDVYRSHIKYFQPLIPVFLQRLPEFQKGQFYAIK